MLGFIGRATLLSLLTLWLALFASLSLAAEGNKISHVFEKLYLWELYQLNIKIEELPPKNLADGKPNPNENKGPSLNKDVMPFWDKKGHPGSSNRGSGPNGALTYSEFIARLKNQIVPGQIAILEKDPSKGNSLVDAARELLDKGLTDQEVVGNLHPRFKGRIAGAFDTFVQGMDRKLTQWRLDSQTKPLVDEHLDNLKSLSKWVVTARMEDTAEKYIPGLFRKERNSGGLALGDKPGTVVMNEGLTSGLPEEIKKTYSTVDVSATYEKNKEAIQKLGFKDRKALMQWLANLGDKEVAKSIDYEKPSRSHRDTLEVWRLSERRFGLSGDELKKTLQPQVKDVKDPKKCKKK